MRRASAVRARQRKLREENANQEAESIITSEDSAPKAATATKGGRSRKSGVSKQKETDTGSEGQSGSSEEQYEVEKIVDMKVIRGVRKYRIRWKGYNSDSDTWEIAEHLNCPDAVTEYLNQNYKNKEVSVASGSNYVSKLDEVSNNTQETENGTSSEHEEGNTLSAKKRKSSKIKSQKKYTETADDENEEEEEEIEDETVEPPAKKRKSTKLTKSPKKGTETADEVNEEEEETEEKAAEESTTKEDSVKIAKPKSKGKKEETSSSEETENGVNEDETSYEVEKIMEVHHKKNGKKEYLIHWRGYPHSQDTWEPEEHLDCEDLIRKFEEQVNKAKNLTVRELRTDRPHTNRYAEEQPAKRHSKRGKGKKRTTYYDTE